MHGGREGGGVGLVFSSWRRKKERSGLAERGRRKGRKRWGWAGPRLLKKKRKRNERRRKGKEVVGFGLKRKERKKEKKERKKERNGERMNEGKEEGKGA